MTLRLSVGERRIIFSHPPRMLRSEAEDFIERHEGWVRNALASLPPPVPFEPGTHLVVQGEEVELKLLPKAGGRLRYDDAAGALWVSGDESLYASRVKRWLTSETKTRLGTRAQEMAATIGREVGAVRSGDYRSRWGSCNARGELMFSWRLLLAPVHVIDAVVAHEVAHLVEMNHSPAFWRLAKQILGRNHRAANEWLKANGALLHSYGVPRGK